MTGSRRSGEPYGIHWFRRDLRLVGNPALERNLFRHPGRVLGVFCFDLRFLARADYSVNRFEFYLRALDSLRDQMRARGGDLLVMASGRQESEGGPERAFRELLETLGKSKFGRPNAISWNRDHEPYARSRDGRMQEIFEDEFGIETLTERDHLLIEPSELVKTTRGKADAGAPIGFYQVYGPFKRKWLELFEGPECATRREETRAWLRRGAPEFSMRWPARSSEFPVGDETLIARLLDETRSRFPAGLGPGPEAGHAAARATIESFRERILAYPTARDVPSVPGTSQISVHLKHGAITVAQIIEILGLDSKGAHLKYLQELVWREFYYHILHHCPRVETEAFNLRYRDLPWENDTEKFERWKVGRTGFPIVDAGMRQLNETGWMHNRVRMITASFLVKDLLVDWRWGERYFMEKLLDGDLAPNNGGWQWAASTGCDPQPYFRIFNPTSQGERFDPDGAYVRRWVPELEERGSGVSIHEPIDAIVDHSVQRQKALDLFRKARKG